MTKQISGCNFRQRLQKLLTGSALLLVLVVVQASGCSGGDNNGGGANPPPPPPPPPPPTGIGPAGGTVTGTNGAIITIPAGALSQTVDIKITEIDPATSSLPAEVERAGAMYALTPHDTTFALPVTVTLPVNVVLPADLALIPTERTVQVLKTIDAARTVWAELGGDVNGPTISAQVTSFSDILPSLVPSPPRIVAGPDDVVVALGDSATFDVTVETGGSPFVTYQWYRGFVEIPGATGANYTVARATVEDEAAMFSVLISNGVGEAMSRQAFLNVASVLARGALDIVSLDANGVPGMADSGLSSTSPAVSEHGRYVVFTSNASLVAGADCGIYLRDTVLKTSQLVTVRPDGSPSLSGQCTSVDADVAMTPDAKHVAFSINRADLVSPPPGGGTQIYVRKTCIDEPAECVPATTLVSLDDFGNPLPSIPTGVSISDDGRYVAFTTAVRVFIHDRDADANGIYDERPANPDPQNPTYRSFKISPVVNSLDVWATQPAISGNGRHIAFIAETDLSLCSQQGTIGICTFVYDRDADRDGVFDELLEPDSVRTINVSVNDAGEVAFAGQVTRPWISRDGRIVSFRSSATNLGGTPSLLPRYAHDRDVADTGVFDTAGNIRTVVASIDAGGQQVNATLSDPMRGFGHSGRFVLLVGTGNWAAPNASSQNTRHAFLRDLCMGAEVPAGCQPSTVRVDVRPDGSLPNGSASLNPALSRDARRVVFAQNTGGLVDLNADGSNEAHANYQLYVGSTGTTEFTASGGLLLRTVVVNGPPGSGRVGSGGQFLTGGEGIGGQFCLAGSTCTIAAGPGWLTFSRVAYVGFRFAGWSGPCLFTSIVGYCGAQGNTVITATFEPL